MTYNSASWPWLHQCITCFSSNILSWDWCHLKAEMILFNFDVHHLYWFILEIYEKDAWSWLTKNLVFLEISGLCIDTYDLCIDPYCSGLEKTTFLTLMHRHIRFMHRYIRLFCIDTWPFCIDTCCAIFQKQNVENRMYRLIGFCIDT